ncbi:MAG: leukotoxin LktA family filamentous adhesin [Selenomonadaceae bacterium]|nr:leukotoxin LktA family filamentous adhesin [Selenomonadaceae bacterium]
MTIMKRSMRKAAQKKQLRTEQIKKSLKLVSSMLAAGFFVSGFGSGSRMMRRAEAEESNIVRINGTKINFENNTANIYAEKISADGSVGLNRFEYFDVASGQVANLFFQNKPENPADTRTVNTLVNMVQNQINIAGTVNAVRDNKIGGHLFFLSPGGMVVSATGVINAGALTVMTPPADFFENAGYEKGGLSSDGKEILF